MKFHTFTARDDYPFAVITKDEAFDSTRMHDVYVKPTGLDKNNVVFMGLPYNEKNKAPVKFIRSHLSELLGTLDELGVHTIYCADANYFKVLTGKTTEKSIGYVLPCIIKEYEHLNILAGINYKSVIYNQNNEVLLKLSVEAFQHQIEGTANDFGKSVIHTGHYPTTIEGIKKTLDYLLSEPRLEIDIEAFSLKHYDAGIASIGFANDTHGGTAFLVDYQPLEYVTEENHYGKQVNNIQVKKLLREFFDAYKGKVIFHNAAYDVKVLIYELYMEHKLDTEGMYLGLNTFFRDLDDTRIIGYLSMNSTANVKLGLKAMAYSFAGDYAQDDEDIKDIRRIPPKQLLEYNLIDCLCTRYVYDHYYPIMVNDQQLEIYTELMLPSQKRLTQTELTGAPLCPKKVKEVDNKLTTIAEKHLKAIMQFDIIKDVETELTDNAWMNDYNKRVKAAKHPENIKKKPRDDFPEIPFNCNSNAHLTILVYSQMGLKVVDLTKGKLPAVGGKTLEKMRDHFCTDPVHKELLTHIIEYGKVIKILNTFIPAFKEAIDKGDGVIWLHGSFNLNGTVSGRLSSSNPNLQNLPSGSDYGKLIKTCFVAPLGWLFVGADFNSLEDYISALTTKDPNKLKVYTDGYEGHCLRAYAYFSENMPDIIDTVESINSISKKYPTIRQDSKAPTFALTYQGTWHTLVKNCGFNADKAKFIEQSFKNLYKVSIDWVNARLRKACNDGYITVAFGLRIRTPLLARTVLGHKTNLYESEAEGRTAGNALGQSYGLLNNRAFVDFMDRVENSKYKHDIKPCLLIHDSMYFVIRDDMEVVKFVNDNLINAMEWQELPEIQHDTVKIGAALDVHYPDWSNPITVSNYATIPQLTKELVAGWENYLENQK